jgi:ABC-type antimicrobial peptide transport system permease subunit
MIKNYFKIAWRNLSRNKSFAITNIFGLALGIACAILIFTVITYHLSFDNFHPNANRIYRVVSEFHYESIEYQQGTPQPMGKAFRNDFSFAEKSARVRTYHDATVSTPSENEVKKFQEEGMVAFADPEFFDIFDFPLIEGNKKTILTEPNTALITQKLAKKYFPQNAAQSNESVIGKIIRITSNSRKADFKITGVLKDLPANTDRKQEIYLSYPNLKDYNSYYASDSSWGSTSNGQHFFVLLKPSITKAIVEKALIGFTNKYYNADDAKVTRFKLQPIADIHFNPDFGGYVDKKYLWALGSIGFFLIITACLNFINLATAQAINWSKEVGVRKVLGGLRSQLFTQFIAETILITLFAALLAYGLAKLALPWLNALFKEELSIALLQNWQLQVFLVLLIIVVVFLSGSYPGIILSRFQPVQAIKGKLTQKNIGGFPLRKILVIVQFAISQMLIIGMIVIAGQMHYSKSSDLGFNKDAVIMLPVPTNDKTKMNTLRTRLSEVAGVQKTSLCFEAPASAANSFTSVRIENHPKDEPWELNLKDGDDQYVSTFGLKLVAGRNFFPSDTVREILVNETLVKNLGLTSPKEMIGKTLSTNGGTINAHVAGVVKDFYNNSFHASISPIAIMSNFDRFRNCAVKLNLAHTRQALDAFKKIWSDEYPDNVYAYHFLDERIAAFYKLDNIMLKMIEIFAGIAILIACLGLYGLVSFMAVQKTKEIGIRKVLGASVQNILWLFGKEFTRLIIIAFVIATPVAWFVMNKWLQDFTYRMQINPWIFLLVIGFTFIVAAITVGYSSLKSAFTNPVKSLKAE